MAQGIERRPDRADERGPLIPRQLVAMLAVELLPHQPGGSLGVDEQAVEVEEEPADCHAVSLPEWRFSASTWAGPSPTRFCSTRVGSARRRFSRPRVRRNPSCRPHGPQAPARSSVLRMGRRSRRTRCSSGRARGRRSSQTRASSTSSTCGARPARISTGRARRMARAARAARTLVRRARTPGPDGELEPLDLSLACRRSTRRPSRSVCSTAYRDPCARAGGRRGAAAQAARTRTSSRRTRSRPSFASTSARRRPRRTRTSGRSSRATCARWPRRARDAGLPAPLVMRSSGGVATLDEAAAHPAIVARLGPGCRSRRRSAARGARRASRTRSRSTWAGRRPTCA